MRSILASHSLSTTPPNCVLSTSPLPLIPFDNQLLNHQINQTRVLFDLIPNCFDSNSYCHNCTPTFIPPISQSQTIFTVISYAQNVYHHNWKPTPFVLESSLWYPSFSRLVEPGCPFQAGELSYYWCPWWWYVCLGHHFLSIQITAILFSHFKSLTSIYLRRSHRRSYQTLYPHPILHSRLQDPRIGSET